jgi:hypothetical protein
MKGFPPRDLPRILCFLLLVLWVRWIIEEDEAEAEVPPQAKGPSPAVKKGSSAAPPFQAEAEFDEGKFDERQLSTISLDELLKMKIRYPQPCDPRLLRRVAGNLYGAGAFDLEP